MTDATWRRAKQVFQEALEKSGPKRARFVAAACGNDKVLLAQVEALLQAHNEAAEFMASPTGGGADEAARAVAGVVAASPPEGPGTRIGPYKLLQLIGEGGFGAVYMAEQEQPIRRRVALKIIKLGMDTKEVIARFEAERQALALMDHPNIAKVLDAGATESGRPYFVMELVRGLPITQYCDANELSPKERLELFVTLCKAVHHAHEKGVVHRDIKPSNVLVTLHDATPVAKVIDFGIAKAMNQPLTEKTLFTAYGEFVGTPAYMSPEQAALGGLEIDRRCDIYALGVLLYELLTGTTPFEGEGLRSRAFLEIMRIIREDDPPTPSARLGTLGERLAEVASQRQMEPHALAKLVRGDLDWIVMKAMEKDRRRRYESAVALAEDVGRHFRHEPVVAHRPSAAYRLQKFGRRRRGPLLAAAAVGLAVVLGSTVPPLGRGAPSALALPVIQPRLTRIIGGDTLMIFDAVLSPDGRWIVFTTITPAFSGSLWIVAAAGGAPRRLIAGSSASQPTWFPDGKRIAYYEDGAGINAVAFDGNLGELVGARQQVTTRRATSSFRISPDGRWIAYVSWTESWGIAIKVVPADGGADRTVYAAPWKLWLMDWSSDGRYLYYESAAGGPLDARRTFRVAVDGGEPEQVLGQSSSGSAPMVPYRIVRAAGGVADRFPLEVRTYDGRSVARMSLPEGAQAGQPGRTFAPDGRSMVAVVSGSATATRVVPVAGGTPEQFGEARTGDELLSWSPNGDEVVLATRLEGRQALMSVSVTSGAAREIGPAPDRGALVGTVRSPITLSADGQYLAYTRPAPTELRPALVIRSVAGGEESIVTHSPFTGGDVAGPGGMRNLAGADFLYQELAGDWVHLRATPPHGPSRLLRSFPLEEAKAPKGVFGDRIAYAAAKDRIVVTLGPHEPEKEVATVLNGLAFNDVVWSRDGRWIAASAYVGTREQDYALKILVVGVTPNGDVSYPARLIDTPIIYAAWGLQWLPDGSAVTLMGQSPPDGRFDTWLVPVRDQRPPVAITSADPDAIGGYGLLSPDGRRVVYDAYPNRGSSIWLADLGDALSRLRRD